MKEVGHCNIAHILSSIERLKTLGYTQEQIDAIPVYIQRIEDHYFENNGWRTNVRPWGFYPEDTTEYIAAFSPVFSSDEDGNLEFCIDAHY